MNGAIVVDSINPRPRKCTYARACAYVQYIHMYKVGTNCRPALTLGGRLSCKVFHNACEFTVHVGLTHQQSSFHGTSTLQSAQSPG